MHVTIPYSSGTVETVVTLDGAFDLLVPVYPSSGEIANPGEMAISTLDGYEAICIKSDQNENVLFSDDAANQAKLSLWYNSANGGLSLAQNNNNGPVLSLSEGVPLNNQTIISYQRRLTLCLTNYENEVIHTGGYSLVPFKDSEPCVVYGYQDNLPDNLSEMKDIKFNILPDGSDTTCELTINNGADIRSIPNVPNAFFCDCVHGLENLEPVPAPIPGCGMTPSYCIKQRVDSDITASFADSSETGCRAAVSHAEGSNSTTFAVGSHAEGYNTSVDGKFSHSEGSQSNASGLCSSVHNSQTSTDSSATASSVYGYQNFVTNVGEFACGQSNAYNGLEQKFFSVGDGTCINQDDGTPMFQATQALCTPHNVFKILRGGDSGNTYYYPLFDVSNTSTRITRNLVIKATVTVNNQPTTLTKTLDEWYEFLINGGN